MEWALGRKALCLLVILALSIVIAAVPAAKGKQLYYCEIPGVIGVVFELPEGWKYEPMAPKEIQKPHHYVIFESGSARICMYPDLPYGSARDWSLSYAMGQDEVSRECLKVGDYEVYTLSYKTYRVVRGDYGVWNWGGKSWHGIYILSLGNVLEPFSTIIEEHDFFFFKEGSRFWLLEGFSREAAIQIITTFRPAFKVELGSNARIKVKVGENEIDPPDTLYLTPFKDYEFEVPEIVHEGTGTRLVFLEWRVGNNTERERKIAIHLSNSISLRAIYKRQFMLNASTDYGQIEGSGWYDEGSWAKVSLAATIVGGPLIRQRFSHWSGDASGTDQSITIWMDGPKSIRAIWIEDYMNLYIFIIALAIIGGSLIFVLAWRRRLMAPPPQSEPTAKPGEVSPGPPYDPAPSPPKPAESSNEKIESYREKLEKLSTLLKEGKISKETYESIRSEYEDKIKRLGSDMGSKANDRL